MIDLTILTSGADHACIGIGCAHIPFNGVAQMMPYLIPDRFRWRSWALSRLIAVLEPARISALPCVPALAQTLPYLRKPPSWLGFFVPSGVPQLLLVRLNGEFVGILKSVEVSSKRESDGFLVIANTAKEFASILQSDLDYTARIVKAAGIKPERTAGWQTVPGELDRIAISDSCARDFPVRQTFSAAVIKPRQAAATGC